MDFHPAQYLSINNDLRNTKYNTPQMAKFHFMNYGIAEGRPHLIRDIYPDYRPEYYNTFNIDLQKYRMKSIDLAQHFLNKGRFENRIYKPIFDSNTVYIYTDNINYSRAEYFENLLKSIHMPCKITTDGILNTNCMYILMTHRQIKLYPFYFLLCLDDYDIQEIIMELSSGILVDNVNKIDSIKKYIHKTYLTSCDRDDIQDSYLMKRVLLANEITNVDLEYNLNSNKIYCITQPEHAYRYKKFDGQRYKPENLEYIVGLKHNVPWIGTGMTYKELAKNAMKQDLPFITICNDDVIFREDFVEKYEKIIGYLREDKNWDMFIGMMNVNDNYLRVHSKTKVDDELDILQVDAIGSLGFVIFRKSMFEKMIGWDSLYRMFPNDKMVNYLQKDGNKLTILTTNPFLVDYNYDVYSTVSKNKKNEMELNKIAMCENIIRMKKMMIR
jgi:hypothetical protein